MSPKTFTVAAAALFAGLAHANNANIQNKCNFDVALTPSNEGTDKATMNLAAGQSWSQPYEGAAWCVKLASDQTSDPTQLEWSVWGDNLLSYDLSNIDTHSTTTFLKYGMSLTSADPSCQDTTCKPAICAPGQFPCTDAYNQPNDVRTLGASASNDINLILCSGEQGSSEGSSSSSSSSSSSVAAPSVTMPAVVSSVAAPVVSAVQQQATTLATQVQQAAANIPVGNENEAVQYVTEIATNVVTVTARAAEPTEAAPVERRHAHHHHGHAHAHEH